MSSPAPHATTPTAGPADWLWFGRTVLLGAGVAFLLSGAIFFFAYNWDSLHRFVKLGTAAGLLAGTGASALWLPVGYRVREVLYTATVVLIGALLAVLGQVYQTGANSYDLFLAWSIFALPWVALVYFVPLWLVYAVLLNVTLVTYAQQVSVQLDLIATGLLLFGLNVGLWAVVYGLWNARRRSFDVVAKLLALWAATNVTVTISSGSFDEAPTELLLTIGLGLTVYAGWVVLALRQRSAFYLAVVGGSVLLTLTFLLLRRLDNELSYLAAGLLVLGGVTLLTDRLQRLRTSWQRPTATNAGALADRADEEEESGIAVKVLSAFGGFFASLLFLLFLWITDLITHPVVATVLGLLLVVTTIVLGRHPRQAFLATLTVCGYLVGVGLTIVGLPPQISDRQLVIPVFLIAVGTLAFTRNYFLVFLAVVSLPACLLYLYLIDPAFVFVNLAVAGSAVALVGFAIFRGRLPGDPRYPAARTGWACGLLMSLLFYRWGYWLADLPPTYYDELPASVTLFALAAFLLWRSLPRPWAVVSSVILLPLTLLPLLLGSLLLLLTGFRERHFAATGLGVFGMLYFTAQYYYDLRWTLLDKSLLLMASGTLLLLAFLLVQRKFPLRATT
ncbi:DUF2157 domain-containing protein [Lewinella sp. JB7]|uniref:DUF2157 domain-containing protein n=1 Tax=Lewinella sp. JB7 TaxID=2962887 RepID=UPI0020C9B4AC|nr:DUF2157 domain-containing protein [Lewinella sp. JB7]MCP9235715.1 DUF4401 domain-containing protein [Lewinella sp. JB7]